MLDFKVSVIISQPTRKAAGSTPAIAWGYRFFTRRGSRTLPCYRITAGTSTAVTRERTTLGGSKITRLYTVIR